LSANHDTNIPVNHLIWFSKKKLQKTGLL